MAWMGCLFRPAPQADTLSSYDATRVLLWYYLHMIYLINFRAVAAVPLAIGGYGAHLAAKIPDSSDRR
jgi:hypothetical protein